MYQTKDYTTYTTADEVDYIRGLGTHHSAHKPHLVLSKEELLILYLLAWWERKKWGRVDKFKVRAYAEHELERLRNGREKTSSN